MLLLLLFTPSWHRIGPCHRHVWRKADPHCWTPDPARHALGLPRALPHHPQDEPGELVPSATFLPRWWDCVWRHSTAHGNLEKLLMDGLAWRCSNLAGIRGPEGIFCFLIYRFLGPFPGMSESGGLERAREYTAVSICSNTILPEMSQPSAFLGFWSGNGWMAVKITFLSCCLILV